MIVIFLLSQARVQRKQLEAVLSLNRRRKQPHGQLILLSLNRKIKQLFVVSLDRRRKQPAGQLPAVIRPDGKKKQHL
jgi:hypothetical protein